MGRKKPPIDDKLKQAFIYLKNEDEAKAKAIEQFLSMGRKKQAIDDKSEVDKPLELPHSDSNTTKIATDDPFSKYLNRLQTQIAQTPKGAKARSLVEEYIMAETIAKAWRTNQRLSASLKIFEDNDQKSTKIKVRVDDTPIKADASAQVNARILSESLNELLLRVQGLHRFSISDIETAKDILISKNSVVFIETGRSNLNHILLLANEGAKHVFGNLPYGNVPYDHEHFISSGSTEFDDSYSKRLSVFNDIVLAKNTVNQLKEDFRKIENEIALFSEEDGCWPVTLDRIKEADTIFTSTACLCSAFEEAEKNRTGRARAILLMLTTNVYTIWVDYPAKPEAEDVMSLKWPSIINVMKERGSSIITLRETLNG